VTIIMPTVMLNLGCLALIKKKPILALKKKTGFIGMDFFAGITIETADVTIDLNGHEIRQSKAFFLQQRHFTAIELSNKWFPDTEGILWFGSGIWGEGMGQILGWGTILFHDEPSCLMVVSLFCKFVLDAKVFILKCTLHTLMGRVEHRW